MMREMIKYLGGKKEFTLSDEILYAVVNEAMREIDRLSSRGIDVWCSNVKHAAEEKTIFYQIAKYTVELQCHAGR